MNRLKFLFFALIVLGLWAFHLVRLSPSQAARASELSAGKASAVAPLVSQAFSDERANALAAAAKAVQNPAVITNLVPTKTYKPEPLSAEKFGLIRDAVLSGLPEEMRGDAVVAVITDGGSFGSKGAAAPVAEGLDYPVLAKAGIDGSPQQVLEGSYRFHSFAVTDLDKTEVKTLGTVAVGLPSQLPDVVAIQKALGLESVALVEGGKVVANAGSDAASKAAATLKPDETTVVESGSMGQLGPLPLKLPIFTNNDPMGGKAPLLVGSRRAISGTPYEVVSIASVAPALEPLVQYQWFAIPALAGLLLFSLIWTLVMGSGKPKEEGKAMVIPDRPELAATVKAPTAPMPAAAVPPAESNGAAASAPLAMPELPEAPEASPDDFEFPSSSAASSAPPPPVQNAPAPGGFPFDGEDGNQPTRAYPAMTGADPFAALGGAPPPPPEPEPEENFNPEATRVAMIPTELLQQAQRQKEEPKTAQMSAQARASALKQAGSGIGVASVGGGGGNPDEAHWQDVYRDFVATRERCGEPADGLTYDKFKLKLQKNKEQLVAKYNCRTVKFQVYVKEGKAALKATPVKE